MDTKTFSLLVWFLQLILPLLFNQAAIATPSLPAKVLTIMDKYQLPHDSISIYIREIGKDPALVDHHSEIARNPASVMKLVTTYAALELLGPHYTWDTKVYADGTIRDDTLTGNLVIQGTGDPFLVKESFWHILHVLQEKGILHINGDLIIDNSSFETEQGNTGDFDKRPYRAYNALPDANLVNFTAQEFTLLPKDQIIHIYSDPPLANIKINNRIKITNGKCTNLHKSLNMSVTKKHSKTVVSFSGTYPRRCGERQFLRTIMDNTDYVYGVFKALWERSGGTISGTGINAVAPESARLIHTHVSRPLSQIIDYINKYSNNVMSRQLLLTLSREDGSEIASKEHATKIIKQWMKKKGINSKHLVIENGSGLSRKARISAKNLAELLEQAWQSPFQPEYLSSLPIAGLDGTMKKRLKGTVKAGYMRMKTGLLNNVRTIAGYVTSQTGKQYVIVSLHNYPGLQGWIGTEIQDALLRWLYQQ